MIIGLLVVAGMLIWVVPQFMDMLKESGQEVPAITQFVIDASNWLQENTLMAFLALVVGFALLASFSKTSTGKPIFDRFMMSLPIFGMIVIKGNLSSFTRTLATMLTAGVSLVDALNICISTVDNIIISEDISKVRKAVVEGKTLTEPISKIGYFPEMVTQMINVGEKTGAIDEMLSKVADVFEDEVNVLIQGMTKLVEPLILVVLGIIVGGILIAMYLPIFMQAGGVD